MASVFDRDLGALSQQSADAKIGQLIDYINYMQRCIEDNNVITSRKIADLQARIEALEV